MEPQDNKQLALQKAISAHEQAAAALADLMGGLSEDTYTATLARVQQNIADLQAQATTSEPGDRV